MKKYTFEDFLITGGIIIIGLAEAAHLAALFLELSFAECSGLLGGLTGAAPVCAAGILLAGRHRAAKGGLGTGRRGKGWDGLRGCKAAKGDIGVGSGESGGAEGPRDRTEMVLYGLFLAALASQLIFICRGDTMYREKDMTVETVGSFLASDAVYQVDPMTGMPYLEGMPLRWKILCLPTLYGSLCRLTGLSPALVVWTIVPAVVLFGCYAAFSVLGKALFPEEGRKRACFLLTVAILLWVGAYGYGMDGFGVLCCGWRGTTIRNGILLPWALSLCIRKKWPGVLLCALAEACIAWTLYGLGTSVALAAGMALAQLCCRKRAAGSAGKEGAR